MSLDPHDNPSGPGDARPTAAQIVEREHAFDRLNDKKVVITGASHGLGLETAKVMASIGCELYLPIRDMSMSDGIVKEIQSAVKEAGLIEEARVHLFQVDLSSLESVRKCAQQIKAKTNTLNILINNAAVMACPESVTVDGFEFQFGVNHIAHFVLFLLLKPLLLSGSSRSFQSRLVSVAASAHNDGPVLFDDYNLKKAGYDAWKAYAQSKTANVYLALEVERRYGSKGIHAWAVHPGGIFTGLQRHMDLERLKPRIEALSKEFKSIGQGAATTVWAATAASLEGTGGKYLEDCRVAKPKGPADSPLRGYAPWAYDTQAAKRLYEESLIMVHMTDA